MKLRIRVNEEKEVYSRFFNKCKTCSTINSGNIHNCLNYYGNYLLYSSTNCLNCKNSNKFVNYEQTEYIHSLPSKFYVNNTDYNTIDKCHNNCLTCNKRPSDDGNMNCLACDNEAGFYLVENPTNCEKNPFPGYYLFGNILKKGHYSCWTCSSLPIFSYPYGEVSNCDTCNNELGFYPIEKTKICVKKTKEKIFYNDDCKCYKYCYKNWFSCSGKEVSQYHMNCLSCDITKGFTYFKKTTNCLNCLNLNKYVNYEQIECIDSIPAGFYVNDTTINTIDKCHNNYLKCSGASSNDEDMKCLSCDNENKFYFLENNNNNCHTYLYPGII